MPNALIPENDGEEGPNEFGNNAINVSIWTEGILLLQGLGLHGVPMPGEIRPQQVSPKPDHAGILGGHQPLPMVPDLLGVNFGRKGHHSVFVCGSAYAGFLEGYSSRHFPLHVYDELRAEAPPEDAIYEFGEHFLADVVANDPVYCGRILTLLGIEAEDFRQSSFCFGDVCKASLVRVGDLANGNRLDAPGDKIVRQAFEMYNNLVRADWLYDRMIQADVVIPLGYLAEQNLAACFFAESRRRGHQEVVVRSLLNENLVVPLPRYERLYSSRYLHRLRNLTFWRGMENVEDAWLLRNDDKEVVMRPVPHPQRNPQFWHDEELLTALRQRWIEEHH